MRVLFRLSLGAAGLILFSITAQAKGRSPEAAPAQEQQAAPAPAATTVPVAVRELPGLERESEPERGRQPASFDSRGMKVQRVWIWQETSDCLWNMAKQNYGNPFLWTRIYEANRGLIKDPNVIFPKQQIVIPPLEETQLPPAAEPGVTPVPIEDQPTEETPTK